MPTRSASGLSMTPVIDPLGVLAGPSWREFAGYRPAPETPAELEAVRLLLARLDIAQRPAAGRVEPGRRRRRSPSTSPVVSEGGQRRYPVGVGSYRNRWPSMSAPTACLVRWCSICTRLAGSDLTIYPAQ
jgi:hypothetical protein